MLKRIISRGVARYLFCAEPKAIEAPKKYTEAISKARVVMRLFRLKPRVVGHSFFAPNCTLVGDVMMGNNIWVGHGTVIRGDINEV